VPEGDTLHRAARRLQVLVGERVEVEAPNPRAQAERVAHPDQLSGALERALQAGKPYVLEVLMTNRPRIRATGHWDVNDILSPKQA